MNGSFEANRDTGSEATGELGNPVGCTLRPCVASHPEPLHLMGKCFFYCAHSVFHMVPLGIIQKDHTVPLIEEPC